jgi:RHS repeat-associated protein
MRTSYAYDSAKNIARLRTLLPDGSLLADYSYTYDGNSSLARRSGPGGTASYSYDLLGRLAGAAYPSGKAEQFAYDRAGNRIRRVDGGTEETYAYDALNRLLELRKGSEVTRYAYDAQGNTVLAGDRKLSYDALNRLTEVKLPTGERQTNRYDAEGLRAEMEENGRLVRFLYRGREAAAEADAQWEAQRRLTRGLALVSTQSGAARFYYHLNEHGDAEELADEDGRVVSRYRYGAFGNAIEQEETIPNRYRYCGEQYDSIAEQYYLRARHYSPATGRFLQEDRYRGDGLNLYTYCRNNPVAYADPSGYKSEACGSKDVIANQAVVDAVSKNLPTPYDGNFAARQILNSPTNVTLGGRTITAHAAERMTNPPVGRVPTSMADIDSFLDTATDIRKISQHPLGDTITLRNDNSSIKEIIVDAATGKRVITVINPR